MSCVKCDLLMELFERTSKTNRDYWVMPEHEFREHISAVNARVGNSHRVLGIKDLDVQSLR